MIVDLKKCILDTKNTPRIYFEPKIFSGVAENVTKDNTLLVYHDDVQKYIPTRCVIDDLGMYLILGIGDAGISIDLTHSIEIREKEMANISGGMQDSLIMFKESSFCIEYSMEMSERATIYLISHNPELAKSYMEMLKELVNTNRLMNPSLDLLIAREFYRLRGFCKCTGKTCIKHFYDSLNIGKSVNIITETLLKGGFINDGTPAVVNWGKLTMEKFQKLFIFFLKSTVEVIECHIMKAEKKTELKFEELKDFIEEHQKLESIFPAENDSWQIYQEIEEKKNIEKNILSLKALHKYIFSEHFCILGSNYGTGFEDMTYPLSYYYMNSSHNTYLTGQQIMGLSSTQMYRNILLSGCRCVEIDVFDGPDQKPIITHGKAMCTTITLYDTLIAIKETAFIVSEYPVVISIENHLSTAQQQVMAEYFETIFQDLLLSKPFEENPLKPGVMFPSPYKLRRKIIIKNKKLSEDVEKEGLSKMFPPIMEQKTKNNYPSLSKKTKKITKQNSIEIEEISNKENTLEKKKNKKSINIFYRKSKNETVNLKDSELNSKFMAENNTKNVSNFENSFDIFNNSISQLDLQYTKENISNNKELNNEKSQNSVLESTFLEEKDCEKLTSISASFEKYLNMENCNSCLNGILDNSNLSSDSSTEDSQKDLSNKLEIDLDEPQQPKKSKSELEKPASNKKSPQEDHILQKVQSLQDNAKTEPTGLFYERTRKNSILNPSTDSSDSSRGDKDSYQSSIENTVINPYLSSLVNYFKASPRNEFEKFDSYYLKISSYNEKAMEKLIRRNQIRIRSYLFNSFLRVFPKPSRVDSSNFNPMIFWDSGIQLVALNFQTSDIPLQLNYAMFEINNRCGYILKPDYLLNDSHYNPFDMRLENYRQKVTYHIKVFTAMFVTDPSKNDLFCQIETYGPYVENISKKIKSTSNSEGNCPVIQFENEKISFTGVLAKNNNFIRFSICDKNTTYGQRIVNIKDIKRGFRFIPLRNTRSQQLPLAALYAFIDAHKQK